MWKIAGENLPKIGTLSALSVVRAFATSSIWLMGWVMTATGWVFYVKAIGLGDLTVVQPLMALGQIPLVIFAVLLLNEKVQLKEHIGIIMAVAGAVIISGDADISSSAVVKWNMPVIFFFSIITGIIFLFLYASRSTEGISMAIAAGLVFGVAALLTKLLTAMLAIQGIPLTFVNVLSHPVLYVVIAANVIGIILLQAALQNGRAAIISPLYLAIANIVGIVSGLTIFNEAISLRRWIAILFLLFGSSFLTRTSNRKETPT